MGWAIGKVTSNGLKIEEASPNISSLYFRKRKEEMDYSSSL
jgi:hypothetical protein